MGVASTGAALEKTEPAVNRFAALSVPLHRESCVEPRNPHNAEDSP